MGLQHLMALPATTDAVSFHPVLKAMNVAENIGLGAVRFSLGR